MTNNTVRTLAQQIRTTGLACGNCGNDLCLKEAIRGCYNCNHAVTDTTCRNYGDGHCKRCGKCVEE